MSVRLVIYQDCIDRIIRELIAAPPVGIDCPVAWAGLGADEEWLLGPVSSVAASGEDALAVGAEQSVVHVAWLSGSAEAPTSLSPRCKGVLWLGRGADTGKVAAWMNCRGELCPADEIYLVGPGLARMPLLRRPEPVADVDLERWSRTRGVMGQAWERMQALRVGVVGAGRSGSVVARLLVRIGVKDLALIDPDTLQRANLGEADDAVGSDWIGELKVAALAEGLRKVRPGLKTNVVGALVSSVRAVRAIKACDVVMMASDHDTARLTATAVAACYARPLIDIATGVVADPAKSSTPKAGEDEGLGQADPVSLQMGLTVRLVLPGRCLACLGGLNLPGAAAVLQSKDGEQAFHDRRSWQSERAGSLASLNELAAALGVRMLEDLMMARVQSSLWLQGNFDGRGRLHLAYPESERTPDGVTTDCPVCSRLMARGDAGLQDLPRIVQGLKASDAS